MFILTAHIYPARKCEMPMLKIVCLFNNLIAVTIKQLSVLRIKQTF